MKENILSDEIRNLTQRGLWETENLIACVPDELWSKRYDGLPMWKYIYHTLFSMDRWFINPADLTYAPPTFHREDLASLNAVPEDSLTVTREQMNGYFSAIKEKLTAFCDKLTDDELTQTPNGCDMNQFRLILGQFRHWHRHMGLIYGFLVEDTGKWPFVLNQLGKIPAEPMPNYYD